MRRGSIEFGLSVLAAVLLGWAAPVSAQQADEEETPTVSLPAPTGDYRVGYSSWELVDPTRAEPFSDVEGLNRQVVVHGWYPATAPADAEPGDYRPMTRELFGDVRKHALSSPAFADIEGQVPVILICPGRGTSSLYYSSLAEEFASHGYAVFAVDSPYIGFASLRDGRVVFATNTYDISFEMLTGPYEAVDEFYEEARQIGDTDNRFALGWLAALNDGAYGGPVAGHLDFDRMGAFGHSLGGRICGSVVHGNDAFKALATMEGVPPRADRRSGFDQAVAMMYSSELPEDMALANLEEVIPERRNAVYISRFEGAGHNSVNDRAVIRPDSYDYAIDPLVGIDIFRRYLLGFFDAHIRGEGDFEATLSGDPDVYSRTFPSP